MAGDFLSDVGAADLARNRDAQATPYQARHTHPQSYLEELVDDFDAHAITDNFVRLAIVSSRASLQEVDPGHWIPGGERQDMRYVAKYVVSSYQARGQMVALSVYCGVAWAARWEPDDLGRTHTQRTALALNQAANRVAGVITKCRGLRQRGGGLYIETSSDPWLAHYMTAIDGMPEITCATCGEAIYYANNDWRHASSKRAEVLSPDKRIEHIADPIEEGRKA